MRRAKWPTALTALATIVAIGLLVLLITYYPFALSFFSGSERDWVTAANIGQAYGGVAAILSGLALCGVLVSIVVQRRQLAIQLNLGVRERQFDLTRALLEYPESAAKLFGSSISTESALLNMYVAQMWLAFSTGEQEANALKLEIALAFQTEEARRWWSHGGGVQWRALRQKPSRSFATMVDEAVEIARTSGLVGESALGRTAAPVRGREVSRPVGVTVGVGLVAASGILLWWAHRRRGPDRGQVVSRWCGRR